MPSIPLPWALPNGRGDDKLHQAACKGSIKDTEELLSQGYSRCIDDRDPDGWTPLMYGAWSGSSSVVGALLGNGASVSIADRLGFTALLLSAAGGHTAVTKILVKAGADLEAATTSSGCTPLRTAVDNRHRETVRMLIEEGANLNSRIADGSTALVRAAGQGCVACIRELLRGKADPTLGIKIPPSDGFVPVFVPLDAAAGGGHLEAVRELIQQLGLEGCGGTTRGVMALGLAARRESLDIMATLLDAGVVDSNAVALRGAIGSGHVASAKLLLQQQEGRTRRYASTRYWLGTTPLFYCFPLGIDVVACFPRMVRLLVDAGADTTAYIPLSGDPSNKLTATPLEFVTHYMRAGYSGTPFTEEQSHRLEAARRVPLQVEAVHAVSWLWSKAPSSVDRAAGSSVRRAGTASAALAMTLPTLRRRAARRKFLFAPLFRHSSKRRHAPERGGTEIVAGAVG